MKKLEEKEFQRIQSDFTLGNWHIYNTNQEAGDWAFENNDNRYTVGCPYLDGISQISENEFFLTSSEASSGRMLQKVELTNYYGDVAVVYHTSTSIENFEKYYKLSKDKFLFKSSSLKYELYSVENNGYFLSFEWIGNYFKEVIPIINEEDNKIYLQVTGTLKPDKRNDFIQFLVDTENFEPASQVYSSLRDSYIDIEDRDDIYDIYVTDKKHKKLVEAQLDMIAAKEKEEVSEKLLQKKLTK